MSFQHRSTDAGLSYERSPVVDLYELFFEIAREHFDGALEPPVLRWNSRLRSAAGRFFPGRRATRGRILPDPPVIEIASYLLEEPEARRHVSDTMAHEMIHFWLWDMGRPYGHTPEFMAKLKAMGASRYNPVPRRRPYKHLYECPGCRKDFPTRRILKALACSRCCELHNGGRYDARFKLVYRGAFKAGALPVV